MISVLDFRGSSTTGAPKPKCRSFSIKSSIQRFQDNNLLTHYFRGEPPSALAAPDPPELLDVVFAEATPHQRTLSWKLNSASRAAPMTTEQYIGRETALSDTLLSSKGGTKYYVLHLRNDPDVIISSCEVTSKRALVSNPSGTREVSAYSIASVFTNPRFRGRGMASFLLRKVQEVVDQTNNECGALYSDIGRSFFTSLGWKDFRSPQAVISMMSRHFHPQKPADVEYLTDMDLIPLCKFDVDAMRRRFRDLGARDGKTHVAFLPTPAQLVWHFTRDRYECEALLGRAVMNRGARTAESESWIVWSHDVREKTLKVLRIVNSQEGERWGEWRRWHMRGLLLAALEEAKEWGLSKVVIWEPSAEVVETVKALWYELGTDVKVAYEVREDRAIPSLRWKGDKDLEDVVWEENQCHAWC